MNIWLIMAGMYQKEYGLKSINEGLERVQEDARKRLYVDGNPELGYTPNLARRTSRGEGEKERLERAIQEIEALKKL